MKAAVILCLASGLSQSLANIPVEFKVTLSCDTSSDNYTGCLRGMHCSDDYTCRKPSILDVPEIAYVNKGPKLPKPRSSSRLLARAYSPNGQCGPQNGGLLCDPDSTVYSGTCCSQYGWCGNTPAHCGQGCVSGCTTTSTTSGAYSVSGECGPNNGGLLCDPFSNLYTGSCCSQYGWCGSTPAHCRQGCVSGCTDKIETVGSPTSTQEPVLGSPSTAAGNGGDTINGTCGAGNGNTVCGNWPNGACCSLYGFCGNTTAHCGNGCQSGPCTGVPEAPVPGPSPASAAPNPGAFNVVGQAGVPAMHAGLLPNGRVVFLDKVENYTQIKLSDGYYAYSAEYDPETNTAIGLSYKTNAFCSGGAFLADGRFVSVGGNAPLSFIDPTVGDGFTAIRYLDRRNGANTGQPWNEPGNKLSIARWYASVQTMPDSTLFVASGSLNGLDPTVPANNNPTFEILGAEGITDGDSITLDILQKNQPYYMYPFIHLLNDGNLFIFVSKSAQVFNVASNQIIQELPDLQGDFRTYPNTGGSVLLPLSSSDNWASDVLICGGGAYQDITSPTDPSCGRIQPLSTNPTWQMESMPEGRGMVEATLLPDGTIIWLNGCNQGAQGFGLATAPTLEALIYNPNAPVGQRFTTGASSTIPRLYHSVALLLLDGTLMVAGSNPVQQPVLTPVPNKTPSENYVTEFRVEIYTPPYLQGNPARPTDVTLSTLALKADGSTFSVDFTAPTGNAECRVVLYHGGFVTHSLHMNHRMLFLDTTGYVAGRAKQTLSVTMPPSRNVAQPGPYVIYVTCGGVPGMGQFVMVS